MSLTLSLARLERWLRERAPATMESLRASATIDATDTAAAQFGVRLLPDLRRLWLWHDGSTGGLLDGLALHPGHYLLGTDAALDEWRSRSEVSGEGDSRSWSPAWIPITADGAGNHLVVDHQPGDGFGSVFPADVQNGPMRHRGWPSLTTLIDNLIDALEQDATIDGHRPHITEGRLTWEFLPFEPNR